MGDGLVVPTEPVYGADGRETVAWYRAHRDVRADQHRRSESRYHVHGESMEARGKFLRLRVLVDEPIDRPAVDRHEVFTIRTQFHVRRVHGTTDRHPLTPQPGHHPRLVPHGQTSSDQGGDLGARRAGCIHDAVHHQGSTVGATDLVGPTVSYADVGHRADRPTASRPASRPPLRVDGRAIGPGPTPHHGRRRRVCRRKGTRPRARERGAPFRPPTSWRRTPMLREGPPGLSVSPLRRCLRTTGCARSGATTLPHRALPPDLRARPLRPRSSRNTPWSRSCSDALTQEKVQLVTPSPGLPASIMTTSAPWSARCQPTLAPMIPTPITPIRISFPYHARLGGPGRYREVAATLRKPRRNRFGNGSLAERFRQ